MYILSVFAIFAIVTHPTATARLKNLQQSGICSDVWATDLESILGGAFNPRYMSIEEPEEKTPNDVKREYWDTVEFSVDNNFAKELDPEPAWNVENHVAIAKKHRSDTAWNESMEETHGRAKKSINYVQQWQCPSKIEWIDLGPEYFPRYLRSLVCLTKNCWFDMFRCKPRSFTVKVLRKKKGFCASARNGRKIKAGVAGLPSELRQLWVWEERAVNFCCDCGVV